MKIFQSIQMFDEHLFNTLFYLEAPVKSPARRVSKLFARLCSTTADGYLYFIIPFLYVIFFNFDGWELIKVGCILYSIERSIYFTLKINLKRKRPSAAIPGFQSLVIPSDEFSFPSGHTSGAFLFTALLVQWFGSVAEPMYLWAICVGLSRVRLGVHFPSDIVVGAVIGSSVGYLFYPYFIM